MRQLSRDPFARTTLFRDTTPIVWRKPCDWCGSRPGRFFYFTEHDGGRRDFHKGGFCSKSCFSCFHTPA